MKKEKLETFKKKLDEEYKGTRNKGERKLEEGKDPKKKPDQPNLFGEQDQVYNTIQEALSTATADIASAQEAISKKEDQIVVLMEWKQKLEKSALTVAKLRDSKLEKKEKKFDLGIESAKIIKEKKEKEEKKKE